MSTLPLSPTKTSIPVSSQSLADVECSPFNSIGSPDESRAFDKIGFGVVVPEAFDVLCVPANAFRSSRPRSLCAATKRGVWAAFVEQLSSNLVEGSAIDHFAKSWLPVRQRASSGWFDKLDKIITELGRLKNGWDGDSAPAPSQSLLNQMERALRALPHETSEPSIEVDPSDGSVAVRWWADDHNSAFSLNFTGNERVYGVFSSIDQPPPPSWDCFVNDETKIIDRIEHPVVRKMLLENA